MNPITLNIIAVAVFVMTMLSLLGPLLQVPAAWVAIATVGGVGLVTLDQLGWQGRGGSLLIDGLSHRSSEHRQRVLHHEAGHFLVAHLFDIPVQNYTLTAWEAWRAGLPGNGGVIFDASAIEAEVQRGVLSAQQLNRYCTVWMAGIAAEQLIYGNPQGGDDDRLKLQILWQQIDRPPAEASLKQRWALLQAQTLIQQEAAAYQALVSAMASGAPVADCRQLIDQHRLGDGCVER